MNYKALINKRYSIREFEDKLIPEKLLNEIKAYFQKCEKLTDDKVEAIIMSDNEVYEELKGVAGYNKIMIKAPYYLLIFSEESTHSLKNSAFIGEQLILKATELGISNCWITINDIALTKQKLRVSTLLPLSAIIALGYGEEKSKVINPTKIGENYSLSKLDTASPFVSSRLSIDEIVYVDNWGNRADNAYIENSGLQEVFFYARLAPSPLNLQPWRYLIANRNLILTIKKSDSHYNDEITAGIQMLYFKLVFEQNLTAFDWHFGIPEGEYDIADDYQIIAYARI